MRQRGIPVIGLIALTSAAVKQPDSSDRFARTDAAAARLRGGTATRDDAIYVLSSFWTAEGGRQQPKPRTVFIAIVVTAVVCLGVIILFEGVGVAWLAAVVFGGGLLLRLGVKLYRHHRNWYGTPERAIAVRSLVGVALDVIGVYRDGYVLPRLPGDRPHTGF